MHAETSSGAGGSPSERSDPKAAQVTLRRTFDAARSVRVVTDRLVLAPSRSPADVSLAAAGRAGAIESVGGRVSLPRLQLELDPHCGGFVCNHELSVSGGLSVAGDAASLFVPILGRRRPQVLETAVLTGRQAALRIAGGTKEQAGSREHEELSRGLPCRRVVLPSLGLRVHEVGDCDSSLETWGFFLPGPAGNNGGAKACEKRQGAASGTPGPSTEADDSDLRQSASGPGPLERTMMRRGGNRVSSPSSWSSHSPAVQEQDLVPQYAGESGVRSVLFGDDENGDPFGASGRRKKKPGTQLSSRNGSVSRR